MASFSESARKLKHDLRESSVVFDSVLSEETVDELCDAIGHVHRKCYWRPVVIILTFLRQVLLTDCSCRQTVAFTRAESREATGSGTRHDAEDAGRGRPSGDPSAYSQARQRLPSGTTRLVPDACPIICSASCASRIVAGAAIASASSTEPGSACRTHPRSKPCSHNRDPRRKAAAFRRRGWSLCFAGPAEHCCS